MHYESVEDERNIDGGEHVLAMFLNKELFWMNNKAIIELGVCIIWRIMEISKYTHLDLHNYS